MNFNSDWRVWLLGALVIVAMIAMRKVNDFYFAWLGRNFPRMLRPRTVVAILAICLAAIVAIIVGLLISETSP
jgi:hypothetical protein